MVKTAAPGSFRMSSPIDRSFDPAVFLASAGLGRSVSKFAPGATIFSQGDPADCVFYMQSGEAKLTVIADSGKEATITRLATGQFFGEESITANAGLRMASAIAVTACTALAIQPQEMIRVLHEEHSFSDLFLTLLLGRSVQTQTDLVDQLFNSKERRLARTLLVMAQFGRPEEPLTSVPNMSNQTLAEIIGSTPEEIQVFLDKFCRMGFIAVDGRIKVHKSLLNVLLHDQSPEQNAISAPLLRSALNRHL